MGSQWKGLGQKYFDYTGHVSDLLRSVSFSLAWNAFLLKQIKKDDLTFLLISASTNYPSIQTMEIYYSDYKDIHGGVEILMAAIQHSEVVKGLVIDRTISEQGLIGIFKAIKGKKTSSLKCLKFVDVELTANSMRMAATLILEGISELSINYYDIEIEDAVGYETCKWVARMVRQGISTLTLDFCRPLYREELLPI